MTIETQIFITMQLALSMFWFIKAIISDDFKAIIVACCKSALFMLMIIVSLLVSIYNK